MVKEQNVLNKIYVPSKIYFYNLLQNKEDKKEIHIHSKIAGSEYLLLNFMALFIYIQLYALEVGYSSKVINRDHLTEFN